MDKPEKAIAVAAGAVFRYGRILLIRRNFEPFIGCWGMPGGKIHFGEHVEEAVVREVREETGVRARFERFCGILSEKVSLTGQKRRTDMHYLVMVSRLRGLSTRISASREGEVRWFPVADLKALREAMIPSDYLMLERFGILERPISTQRHKGTKSETSLSTFRPLDHLATVQSYARCRIAKQGKVYRVVRFD